MGHGFRLARYRTVPMIGQNNAPHFSCKHKRSGHANGAFAPILAASCLPGSLRVITNLQLQQSVLWFTHQALCRKRC
jgi:hypothetical protein